MKLKNICVFLFLALLACSTEVAQKPIKLEKPKLTCKNKPTIVAVIDTGFNVPPEHEGLKLCKSGHKNFSLNQNVTKVDGISDPIPADDSKKHGTNVVGIISKYAGDSNYCIVILKYFDRAIYRDNTLNNTVKAIKYATEIGAKYINYSGGGTVPDEEEISAVKEFLDKGGTFISAAGNEGSDIDTDLYYPAKDDPRVISVGSIEKDDKIAYYSNYGKSVTKWEYGTNVVGFNIKMSGTSQATAIVTGKIIKKIAKCEK